MRVCLSVLCVLSFVICTECLSRALFSRVNLTDSPVCVQFDVHLERQLVLNDEDSLFCLTASSKKTSQHLLSEQLSSTITIVLTLTAGFIQLNSIYAAEVCIEMIEVSNMSIRVYDCRSHSSQTSIDLKDRLG